MFVRRIVGVVAAAALVAALSACSGLETGASGCTPAFASGGNAALVSADGSLGSDPQASFPTPMVAETVEVESTIVGDGSLVGPGDGLEIQITIYNGTTGETLIATEYTGTGLLLTAIEGPPAWGAVAQCATAGSRLSAVGSAGELVGQATIDQYSLPVASSDTVVMTVDVINSFPGRATGVDQLAQAGFPSVVLAPNGQPGFTIPSSAAPTELKIDTLKRGSGVTVSEGDTVIVNYTGVLWETGGVFDSTWERNTPAALLATSITDDPAGVVPGFATALIGATVGSQVLMVIPPEFGYPAGSAPSSIPDGSTMVFVVDVLEVAN